jgi:hypothetical protein
VPVTGLVKRFCLLLNVVQSAALKAPLLEADAVGTFKVIEGVVVLLVTLDDKSVPLVPKVNETLVTVPTPAPPTKAIVPVAPGKV